MKLKPSKGFAAEMATAIVLERIWNTLSTTHTLVTVVGIEYLAATVNPFSFREIMANTFPGSDIDNIFYNT